MEKIIRYKNGSLYSAQEKEFLSFRAILVRKPGTFFVIDAATKKDITKEIAFLAEVEHIKAMNAYDKVRIVSIE